LLNVGYPAGSLIQLAGYIYTPGVDNVFGPNSGTPSVKGKQNAGWGFHACSGLTEGSWNSCFNGGNGISSATGMSFFGQGSGYNAMDSGTSNGGGFGANAKIANGTKQAFQIGSGMNAIPFSLQFFSWNFLDTLGNATFKSVYGGTHATFVVANSGAGLSPIISVSGNNIDGVITLKAGRSPAASAVVATVTFGSDLPSIPNCVILPGNAASAALFGVASVYAAGDSRSSFQLLVGSAHLVASTEYRWKYQCLR
jgi:hypothetical protein